MMVLVMALVIGGALGACYASPSCDCPFPADAAVDAYGRSPNGTQYVQLPGYCSAAETDAGCIYNAGIY